MQAGTSHTIFYLKIVSKKQKKHGVLETDRLCSESLLVGICNFGYSYVSELMSPHLLSGMLFLHLLIICGQLSYMYSFMPLIIVLTCLEFPVPMPIYPGD